MRRGLLRAGRSGAPHAVLVTLTKRRTKPLQPVRRKITQTRLRIRLDCSIRRAAGLGIPDVGQTFLSVLETDAQEGRFSEQTGMSVLRGNLQSPVASDVCCVVREACGVV